MAGSMGCGIGCIVGGVLFLVLGIVAIMEKSRFDPFYTKVQCDNLFLDIPLKYALHTANPTVVNGTVTNLEYTVTVMGGPQGLADAGNQVTTTAPAITPTAFNDAPFVPMPVTCKNANELKLDLISASGRVLVPNHATPTDYSTYFPIGKSTLMKAATLPAQGSGSLQLGLKLQTPDPISKVLFAGVGNPAPGVAAAAGPVCTQNCIVPIFFDLETIATEGELTLLGLTNAKKDLLPPKYCSQYVKARHDGNGDTYLVTTSPTYCRNTAAEIIAHMFSPAVQGDAVVGTVGPHHGTPKKGYIDNLDPLPKTLKDTEDQVGMMTTLFTVIGFVLCVVLVGAGVWQIVSSQQAAPQGDIENAA